MTYHPVTAVGAVLVNDQLTVVVRRGDMLEEPRPFTAATPLSAAAILLKQRGPDGGVIFIEAGGAAAQVLAEVKRKYSGSRDELVNWLSQPQSMAEKDVFFYNRRSELFYRFKTRVVDKKLFLPPSYTEQFAAFAESELNGKIFFPSPDDVAAKLGKFPAVALAAVLAAIEPARSGPVPRKSDRVDSPYGGR
jgi:hypothetical protein